MSDAGATGPASNRDCSRPPERTVSRSPPYELVCDLQRWSIQRDNRCEILGCRKPLQDPMVIVPDVRLQQSFGAADRGVAVKCWCGTAASRLQLVANALS